ncbi:hypothetical protein AB0K09_04370 [Streptomyces sp. NPDC049577]|uniref:hypothetical protein n=1 Tax=Streptomyces sp. NPDC049577 TaxID=3155153 RepID=UPI003428455F
MTGGGAPMGMALRGLLVVGGFLAIVLGAAVLFFAHNRLLDLTGTEWFVTGLALRAAEAGLVSGGAWLVVRGWNGGSTA